MSVDQFEYEVALSFTQDDEGLANQLETRLTPRMRVFIYSKKQEHLAGTDGDKSFGEVFGAKARVVVILYRDKWGATPWTRIEETAIKNRAFNKGYDFTIWIPTTSEFKLPEYVPKVRLYFSLEHYGMDGAAAMIEARVQDAGGTPRHETLEERAARLQGQIAADEKRRGYLNSETALQDALVVVAKLFEELPARTKSMPGWTFSVKRDKNGKWLDICTGLACLGVTWRQQYGNVVDESRLDVGIWDGLAPRAGRLFINGDPPRRFKAEFAVDADPVSGEIIWVDGRRRIAASKMVEHLLELLLAQAHANALERKR